MSETYLFCIRDNKAETCDGPIIKHRSEKAVIRDFHRLLNDKNTEPGRYPEDYDLLRIGTQDESTGQITPHTPETLAYGREWKQVQENVRALTDTNTGN